MKINLCCYKVLRSIFKCSAMSSVSNLFVTISDTVEYCLKISVCIFILMKEIVPILYFSRPLDTHSSHRMCSKSTVNILTEKYGV